MKHKLRNDLVLLAIILLISGICWFGIQYFAKPGSWVVIQKDGTEIARLPVNGECEYTVADEDGTNIVRIENGSVWMEIADCPDRLCVKQGRITKSVDRIVCLPHRVVVFIEGSGESEDAVLK